MPKFINDLINNNNFDFFRAVLLEEEKIDDLAEETNYQDFVLNDLF